MGSTGQRNTPGQIPPRQIEYWVRIGKIAEENPELTLGIVKDILISQEEAAAGDVTEYEFG